MWSDNWNVVLHTQLHWIHSSIMQATNRKDGNCAIWQIHFGNFINNILFLLTVLDKAPFTPLLLSVLHFTGIQSYGYRDQRKVKTDTEVTED